MKTITGKMRLAILLSVIWFLMVLAISLDAMRRGGLNELIVNIIFTGSGPLILLWGISWVAKGFRYDKKQKGIDINEKRLSDRDKKIIDSTILMILIRHTDNYENKDITEKSDALYEENIELCDNVHHYFFDALQKIKKKVGKS